MSGVPPIATSDPQEEKKMQPVHNKTKSMAQFLMFVASEWTKWQPTPPNTDPLLNRIRPLKGNSGNKGWTAGNAAKK